MGGEAISAWKEQRIELNNQGAGEERQESSEPNVEEAISTWKEQRAELVPSSPRELNSQVPRSPREPRAKVKPKAKIKHKAKAHGNRLKPPSSIESKGVKSASSGPVDSPRDSARAQIPLNLSDVSADARATIVPSSGRRISLE